MSQRLDYAQQSPALFKEMVDLSAASAAAPVNQEYRHLVNIRASQINGCAFCLDMHVKEAKIAGERELRLHHLVVWRESPLFSQKEKAVLEWTEAVTKLSAQNVPDDLYARVRKELSEKEISDLTFAIITINAWNRLSIAFNVAPGTRDAAYGLDKAGLT